METKEIIEKLLNEIIRLTDDQRVKNIAYRISMLLELEETEGE